ncbi:unnamed protein product [Discula destructiva]
MRLQHLPRIPRKPRLPIYQRAAKPLPRIILHIFILRPRKPEAVRAPAVLVVHDFSVRAVQPAAVEITRPPYARRRQRRRQERDVAVVLRDGDEAGDFAGAVGQLLHEHDDVLLVVRVPAGVGHRALHRDVLLEVVGVHVRAPAVVAPRAHVHVVVAQVG